jgi:hypothetical protein
MSPDMLLDLLIPSRTPGWGLGAQHFHSVPAVHLNVSIEDGRLGPQCRSWSVGVWCESGSVGFISKSPSCVLCLSHARLDFGVQWDLPFLRASGSTHSRYLVSTCWHFSRIVFFFVIYLEMESCYIAQAGFKLLSSSDPPASVYCIAGTAGVHHCACLGELF